MKYLVLIALSCVFTLGYQEGQKSLAPEVQDLRREFTGATNIVNELADEVILLGHERDQLRRDLAHEKRRSML